MQEKENMKTSRVSMLLKSRASLTCFRACFLPGRAKDLSAPGKNTFTKLRLIILKGEGKCNCKKKNSYYIGCPTRYRTRHLFNNSNTNEDIATKFEQEYVRCVRNEEECVCSVCL